MKPFIGVVAHTEQNQAGKTITAIPLAYTSSLERAGGVPIILPFTDDFDLLEIMLKPLRGILVPGGDDVAPALYNETALPQIGKVNEALDRYQAAAVKLACARKKPVLGICRGIQLVNVVLGGTLFQDIPSQFSTPTLPHTGETDVTHSIDISPGSRLSTLFGSCITVNSRHHQSIRTPGEGLVITARAPDGVVEAAQHRFLPIDLVQWHPERMLQTSAAMLPLFKAFVEKCR